MKKSLFLACTTLAIVFSLVAFTQVKAALVDTSTVAGTVEATSSASSDSNTSVTTEVENAMDNVASPSVRRLSTTGTSATQIKAAAEISTVVSTVNDLQDKASSTQAEVTKQLEDGITQAIQTITTAKPEIKVETLNAAIQAARLDVISKQKEVLSAPDTNTAEKVDGLSKDIESSIKTIEKKLSDTSGVKVSIDSFNAIQQSLDTYKTEAVPYVDTLNSHKADLLFVDSDNDGLSDYDEVNVYHTDPHNPKTVPGDLTDGEKVLRGINPLSTSSAPVIYRDVTKTGSTTPDIFSVNSIELKKTATTSEVVLQGHAAPNSIVTLYIFSTPIIVAVKADAAGQWTYSLDKELENGNHQVYVATVDNSGRVLAKSNPIPFIKTAEAATLDTQNLANVSDTSTVLGFLRVYFWQILLIILGVAFALGFFDIGKNSKENTDEAPTETK